MIFLSFGEGMFYLMRRVIRTKYTCFETESVRFLELLGRVYTIPHSFSCRREEYSCLVWTETAENWNKSFRHRASCRSGWPRGLGVPNSNLPSWKCTSVSVASGYRSYSFTTCIVRLPLYPKEWHRRLFRMWLSTFQDRHGAASLRYRNRVENTVLMCIRYGCHAGARAIRYIVDTALMKHCPIT